MNVIAKYRLVIAKTPCWIRIAKLADLSTHNLLVIELCVCLDLSEQTDLVRSRYRFNSCMTLRVLRKCRVHYRVEIASHTLSGGRRTPTRL